MSAGELRHRVRVKLRQIRWRDPARRAIPPGAIPPAGLARRATVRLPRPARGRPGWDKPSWDKPSWDAPGWDEAETRLIAEADALLAGDMTVLGLRITGLPAEPDWFRDPLTGRRTDPRAYCFDVPYRDEERVGNIKYLWEPARHQAATQLAAAWWLTGRDAYAERAATQLRSWWRDNPFLHGVHWVSGIEVGVRLLSWTWIRALLADWDGCAALFDDNRAFLTQLYDHQRYLVAFHSQGSSANNHLIAELAGLATAAVAFPWFAESPSWAAWARAGLVEAAVRQTGADGGNREQASEYHLFVFELLFAAELAARLAGDSLAGDPPAGPPGGTAGSDRTVAGVLGRMADLLAASLDAAGAPPRQGDGDGGRGLLLDAAPADAAAHAQELLGTAAALLGAADWWPPGRIRSGVLAAVTRAAVGPAPASSRRPVWLPPAATAPPDPLVFEDTGQAILRAHAGADQIWLRCDHGPLGYLSIAAHGHADALSVELRHGGTDILADPGTYCYHGELEWRRYFKGTAGHNTLAVDGRDQAVNGGPFLWLTRPVATLEDCRRGGPGTPAVWRARHDGYRRLRERVTHHRRVSLDATRGVVEIEDWIDAARPVAVLLSWHLGPAVRVEFAGAGARLAWAGPGTVTPTGPPPGTPTGTATGTIELPRELDWTAHRGETTPPRGWYSRRFGQREPAPTLAGRGVLAPGIILCTRIALPVPDAVADQARATAHALPVN
jgi:hypothetical protein